MKNPGNILTLTVERQAMTEKITYNGSVCPHCGNDATNMRRMIFTKNLVCDRCKNEVQDSQLRNKSVVVVPNHWARKTHGCMNPDVMVYPKLADCIFDHIRNRAIDTDTGKAPKSNPLKLYRKGRGTL